MVSVVAASRWMDRPQLGLGWVDSNLPTVEKGHALEDWLEKQRVHSEAATCLDVLPYAPWKAADFLTSLTASWLQSWSRPKTTSS